MERIKNKWVCICESSPDYVPHIHGLVRPVGCTQLKPPRTQRVWARQGTPSFSYRSQSRILSYRKRSRVQKECFFSLLHRDFIQILESLPGLLWVAFVIWERETLFVLWPSRALVALLEKRASFGGNQKALDPETKRGKSNLIHLIHVIADTSRNVSKDDLLFSLKLPNVWKRSPIRNLFQLWILFLWFYLCAAF